MSRTFPGMVPESFFDREPAIPQSVLRRSRAEKRARAEGYIDSYRNRIEQWLKMSVEEIRRWYNDVDNQIECCMGWVDDPLTDKQAEAVRKNRIRHYRWRLGEWEEMLAVNL